MIHLHIYGTWSAAVHAGSGIIKQYRECVKCKLIDQRRIIGVQPSDERINAALVELGKED